MCYNCGCEMTHDDKGKGKISEGGACLTDSDFMKMAKGWDVSVEEAKRNVFKVLSKEFKK